MVRHGRPPNQLLTLPRDVRQAALRAWLAGAAARGAWFDERERWCPCSIRKISTSRSTSHASATSRSWPSSLPSCGVAVRHDGVTDRRARRIGDEEHHAERWVVDQRAERAGELGVRDREPPRVR